MSKKHSRSSRCCVLILLVLVACAPAVAQYKDSLGGNWNNPASATITNIIMDRYARRRLEKNLAAKHSSTAPAAKLNDASVHFRSTGTQLKTREIADLVNAGNPQVLTIMTTILEEYEKAARAAGKPNDLALALSFFFSTNASVYHDAGIPADPQVMELRDTIAEALVEGNAFSSVSDRQKQEMYETLVLFTGFALAVYQEGKGGNAESLKISQQLAGQNLLAVTRISPDKINFTDQGLSIEREPAAATATATQSPTQPASPQNAPSATVNAGKLVIDFEGNEVRANQMYAGKRIRINGTVNSIEILKDGRITLTFHSPAAGYAHTRCYFNKSQSSRLAQMSGGQEVIVEGTVRGFSDSLKGYVEVENCIVP
jgi:tRNA_anti-like